MGTRVTLTVHAGSADLDRRAAAAFAAFTDLEDRFSLFRPGSEISRINRAAGETVEVSRSFATMLGRALAAGESTGGLFSPFVGAVTAASHGRPVPAAKRPAGLLFDGTACRLCLPKGAALDLNAIVKGSAIDAALARFGGDEPAMIEAGGDLLVRGDPPGREAWSIGVRDPADPRRVATVLRIRSGAVCTSGDYFRRGRPHLVDPRTGRESGPSASVTVAAPTAEEADILSTAACFLEPAAAIEFVEARGAACLVIDRRGGVFAGPAMRELFAVKSLCSS